MLLLLSVTPCDYVGRAIMLDSAPFYYPFLLPMIWSESTIILAIIGMVGLFSSALIYQRANRITSRYYGTKQRPDVDVEVHD